MKRNDFALEIKFIHKDGNRSNEKFGALSNLKGLAIQPETTGATLLAEALQLKKVSTPDDYKQMQLAKLQKRDEKTLPAALESEKKDDLLFYESVIGNPDYLPAWFLETGKKRASAVCKIETSGMDYKQRQGNWGGTGFLISDNLLMTNHHVINSPQVAKNAICIFNYQLSEEGEVLQTKVYKLNPKRLFITSKAEQLDFTICWIDEEAGVEFGCVPIYRHAFTIRTDDCANIVQHPNGRYKSVVVQKNEITDQNEVWVHYNSDTEPGSSGAFVCNNEWKLVAIHHASRQIREARIENGEFLPAIYQNEGIKLSAIATYLEGLAQKENNKGAASEVLSIFRGTDSLLGFFGSLGRSNGSLSESDLELVRDSYEGEAEDLDIGFWNIEWFNRNYKDKIGEVAQLIVRMNLDIWAFEESSPEATEALVMYLLENYQADYGFAASEPKANSAKQSTTIIWNKSTVHCTKENWPDKIESWFALNSKDYDDAADLNLEAVDGKIFDRYPGLFKVETINRGKQNIDLYLVPLHLKAREEGSKRRSMASRILAAAVHSAIHDFDMDKDWILGGDFNATLASGDLDHLTEGNLIALSAQDEEDRAFTYIKKPFQNVIDHIFLSPGLQVPASEFFIVAQDRVLPDYKSISDHRPILARLSFKRGKIRNEAKSVSEEKNSDIKDLIHLLSKLEPMNGHSTKTNTNTVHSASNISEPETNSLLKIALEEFHRSSERDYYNEESDLQNIKNYYTELHSLEHEDELFNSLNSLITSTHKKQLPYKPALYLYPWVDLQSDKLTLRNIYSGDLSDPEEFIRQDIETESKLEALRLELNDKEELERYESEFQFNCEHVVPQSWFNKANPMRGDLHHLFSCHPRCNSFRSNTPYYEFVEWEEKTMEDCGRSETNAFEPKDGKGIVARATLYFLLRYPGQIRRGSKTYTTERVKTLIAWHFAEPPKAYEKHRNAAIQELQGNRNPLIDFPKLATRIDFSLGLG